MYWLLAPVVRISFIRANLAAPVSPASESFPFNKLDFENNFHWTGTIEAKSASGLIRFWVNNGMSNRDWLTLNLVGRFDELDCSLNKKTTAELFFNNYVLFSLSKTGCGVISATNHDFWLRLSISFDLVIIEKFWRYPLRVSSNRFQLVLITTSLGAGSSHNDP